jgi:hypothetical protein
MDLRVLATGRIISLAYTPLTASPGFMGLAREAEMFRTDPKPVLERMRDNPRG